jgi:prolyl-tRNA synthetase
MRWTEFFLYTVRETPADAEAASHRLMLRAGMIQRVAAGIYTYLPLGLRVIQKLEKIVREEMNRQGAIELLMPAVAPAELWQESGRWSKYGKELLRLKDRHGRDFCFGPTHEEVVTDTVRKSVTSYRQLPINLYQIQTKFRDEVRPRFGLLRGREFTMKDAYSFDVDEKGLDVVYRKMIDAYSAIFTRCRLEFTMVESDVGAIGGASAHEFMVLAETGEDAVVKCRNCDYGANLEKASTAELAVPEAGPERPIRKAATPGQKTIEEVCRSLSVTPVQCVKTLIFETDKEYVAALVRGDLEVNEIKLKNQLGADHLQLASDAKVEQVTGGPSGFSGPVGLKGLRIVADRSVLRLVNVVVGANERDAHWVDANPGRDFSVEEVADIASARSGDLCPRCGGPLEVARGIEVGNIFKLGTKYSEPMDCSFLDEAGAKKPMVMGCYGLGIGRTVAAVIEQNHDDNGILWPAPLSPFDVHLVAMNVNDAETRVEAERVDRELREKGIDVLYDDRDERPGVKFKDADLLGIPLRINVGGRSLKEGKIEIATRREGKPEPLLKEQAVEAAVAAVHQAARGPA